MQVVKEKLTTVSGADKKEKIILIQTNGLSMRPFLKGGEKVIIKKTKAEDLKVGDIVAYRSCFLDKIVCHRLIKRVREKNDFVLYTRGDACFEPDKPISPDVLIGRVTTILKGRRVIGVTGGWHSLANFLIVYIYPPIRIILRAIRRMVSFLLRLLQQFFLYRKAVKFLFYDKVDCYGVKSKEDKEKFCRFYQVGIPFDPQRAHTVSGRRMLPLHRFIAVRENKVVGVATLIDAEDGSHYPGWWVHGFYVLLRFGGAGIEQKLMQAMMDFASKEEAPKINLAIKDRGMFTCRPLQELGFKKVDEKVIKFGSNSSFNRYFLMEKELK